MRNMLLFTMMLIVPLLASVLAAQSAGDRLRARFEADWRYWMTQYPDAATLVGYPGQDARWPDYSPAAIDSRAAYLKQSLADVVSIPRGELSARDAVSYDLYREMLESAVEGLKYHNDAMPIRGVVAMNLLMPLTQLSGPQQDIPRVFASMPASTRDDYENHIRRLEGVGVLIDQTIAMMERGVAARVTPPRIAVRDLPKQVADQVPADAMKSGMLTAFTRWPDSIPAADRAAFTGRAMKAYERSVRPAFLKLHDFLVKRYLPACRETTAASALPDGAALYAYNVEWHTTTTLTPKQIHEIGLAEVKRIRGEMSEIIARSGFKGSYADFVTFLRTDPRFYYTDAPSLLTGYRDVAKRADPELARLFGRLPQNPYGVKPIPDAIAPSQTTAYYDPGSFAAGRPGYMAANTYKLDARPKWEMEALTLHEAVPGHHLQISLAQEMQGLPEFRKNTSYTGFVEGWALYAESLGEEMGFYADPYSKFGQLTYDMWRAVRLVVDTGLHSMGWTRDQAITFFRDNAAKTQQDIVVEVDRYIVWPGQALGYKIGQLKIRELRASATRELGAKFDVRRFHDVVLGEGAVPLDVLERRVKSWIAAQK